MFTFVWILAFWPFDAFAADNSCSKVTADKFVTPPGGWGERLSPAQAAAQFDNLVKGLAKKSFNRSPEAWAKAGQEQADLEQEARMVVLLSADKFDPMSGGPVNYYTTRINQHFVRLLTASRRQKRSGTVQSDDMDLLRDPLTVDGSGDSLGEQVVKVEAIVALKRFIAAETREIQEMFRLYYSEGLTFEQIKERMGKNSKQAVQQAIQRARDRILKKLEASGH